MMIGSLLLFLLIFPLLLLALITVIVLVLKGQAPDILQQLRGPSASVEKANTTTRHCTDCGKLLQRGWAFCPGCSVEVHWV